MSNEESRNQFSLGNDGINGLRYIETVVTIVSTGRHPLILNVTIKGQNV
jgi:hypothetical protein